MDEGWGTGCQQRGPLIGLLGIKICVNLMGCGVIGWVMGSDKELQM